VICLFLCLWMGCEIWVVWGIEGDGSLVFAGCGEGRRKWGGVRVGVRWGDGVQGPLASWEPFLCKVFYELIDPIDGRRYNTNHYKEFGV